MKRPAGNRDPVSAAGESQKFRLYIAGESPNSLQALSNLQLICRQHLAGRHSIEVVDILQQPDRLLSDGIVVTPTLLRLDPAPRLQIVGSLARQENVLAALGLGVTIPHSDA